MFTRPMFPAVTTTTMDTAFSCQRCYERKVKCDKARPRCSNCVRHDIPCEPSQAAAASKKRRREPNATPEHNRDALLDRLERYESVLVKLSSEVAALRSGSRTNSPRPPRPPEEEFEDMQSFLHAAEQEPDQDPITEMSQQLLLRSDDTAAASGTIQNQTIFEWLDRVFKGNDVTAVLYGPPEGEGRSVVHPSPFDASQLWNFYCENIHPIAKMVDLQAMQRLIRQVSGGAQVSPGENALLFAVYSAAATSVAPEHCVAVFGKNLDELQTQMRSGTRYWLHEARFWKTQEFVVLQAYVIFLSGLHRNVDPRSIATFTATADRIAKRIGLHRPTPSHIDSTTAEMRRRVWWELQIMEARSCEKCGLGASVLANNRCIPMPSIREDPGEHVPDAETNSPSPEMLCYLVRVESCRFLAGLRLQQGGEVGWTEFSTEQWSLAHKLTLIRDFQQRVELKYLIHCDARDRVQHFTKRLADLIIARMRLAAYIAEESLHARRGVGGSKFANAAGTDAAVDASDEAHTVRTQMLMLCLQVMENFGFLLAEPTFRGFLWILQTNMPFVAFVHLFRLLRTHTTGPLVDRIWASVEANALLWRGPPPAPGAKQTSLFNYPLMKAWTARRAGLAKIRREGEEEPGEPMFIQAIRKAMAENESPHRIGSVSQRDDQQLVPLPEATDTVVSTDTTNTTSLDTSADVDWEQWFQDFLFDGAGPGAGQWSLDGGENWAPQTDNAAVV